MWACVIVEVLSEGLKQLHRLHRWKAESRIGGRGVCNLLRLWKCALNWIPDVVGCPYSKTLSYVDLWNFFFFASFICDNEMWTVVTGKAPMKFANL